MMKPLGRKQYKDKTGGKHGSWWHDLINPSKRSERQESKRQIQKEIKEPNK